MECSEKIKTMLALHAEGSVSGAEKAGLEAHLSDCPACRAELDELRKLFAMLANAGLPEPSREFLDKLPEKVCSALNQNKKIVPLRPKKAPRWIAVAAAAAIAVFVITAGMVLHLRQVQPPARAAAREQIAPEDILIAALSDFTTVTDISLETSISEYNQEEPESGAGTESLEWIESRMAKVLPPDEKDIFETMASFTDEEVGNVLANIEEHGGDS